MRTPVLLSFTLLILLVGCDDLAVNNKPKEPKTLDGLLAHLTSAGCELGERRDGQTRRMQALAGCEIDVDGGPIEFYEFKEIYSVGDIVTRLRSFAVEGKLVLVNENLAMIGDRKQDNWKKTADAFKSY